MTIAKAVVTGTIFRAPEKRFTSNDVAVSTFVMDIGEREETLIRVISKKTVLDSLVSSFSKGDRVLVEGRLQTTTAKMEDGSERKIFEIDAATIEKMDGTAAQISSNNDEIVKFAQEEFSDELISEDEIPF